MGKGSGTTRKSSSGSPKGLSVSSLVSEAKSLGVSTNHLALFEKASEYGNYRNAPASFVKEFDWEASNAQMNLVNKAEQEARAIMDKKVTEAFEKKSESMYNAAHAEYEERMRRVREFAGRMNKIQNKFFS